MPGRHRLVAAPALPPHRGSKQSAAPGAALVLGAAPWKGGMARVNVRSVRASKPAHEPAERKRDRDRRVRPGLDVLANRLLEASRLATHGGGRIAGRLASLAVEILGGADRLLHGAFDLALDVAGGSTEALFELAAHAAGGAFHAICIHHRVLTVGVERLAVTTPQEAFGSGDTKLSHDVSQIARDFLTTAAVIRPGRAQNRPARAAR